MNRTIRKAALAAGVLLGLAACGPLIGVPGGDAPARFTLLPPDNIDGQRLPVSLMVEEPATSDALDGRRIALTPSPLEVRYFAKSRWTDRAPQMMQNLMLDAFRNRVADVGGETMPTAPDYRLQSRIVDFQAIYEDGEGTAPLIKVTLDLKLFTRSPMRLAARERISTETRAAQDRMPAIAEAFNKATQEALRQTVQWATDEMVKADEARRTTNPEG